MPSFVMRKIDEKLILATTLTLISGCAVTFEPRDLSFESVYLVSNPYENSRRSILQADPTPVSKVDGQASHLAIVLSSATNLFEFSRKNDFHIGHNISYCTPPPNTLAYITSGGLYTTQGYWVDGSTIKHLKFDPDDEIERTDSNRFHYIAFVRMSSPGNLVGDRSTHHSPYDLREIDSDICVRLSGGVMWGYSLFRSNKVSVPRMLIMETTRKDQ